MNPLSSVALLTPYVESLRRHSEMLRSAQLSPIGNGQVQSFTVVKTIWVWNQTSRTSYVFYCFLVSLRFQKHSKSTTFELRSFATMCYAHFAYFVYYIYKHDATHNLYKGLRHTCNINLQHATTPCKYQWILRRYPSWGILYKRFKRYNIYKYIYLYNRYNIISIWLSRNMYLVVFWRNEELGPKAEFAGNFFAHLLCLFSCGFCNHLRKICVDRMYLERSLIFNQESQVVRLV